jgi:signal transduction histidine kinase
MVCDRPPVKIRRVAGGLGRVINDLNPVGGGTLPPVPGAGLVLAWFTHAALIVSAVVIGLVTVGRVTEASPGSSVASSVALGVAQGLPLVLVVVRPMAGFWVSILVGAVVSEAVRAGGPGAVWAEPSLLVHLAVLAVVGLRCRARVLPALWLVTLLAGAALVQRMPGMNASADLADMSTLSAVVLVAAGALRGRRDALRRLADQERISHAERAHRSVLEERARIARELHDVVAHHMSLIAIQAEAAPYRVADPPPELARSFATIRASAVEAMTELRRVLGLLRDRGEPVWAGGEPVRGRGEPQPEGGPQPRLNDLAELVAAVRAAGVEVEYSVTGEVRPLDPGVELSGYRIVQEALSNALRHAPGAAVRVTVEHGGDGVTLSVVNGAGERASSTVDGAGHGLVGMRERVAMLGGRLSVGPRAAGGYAVTAVLPAGEGG